MPSAEENRNPKRPVAHTLVLIALWIAFYASFTLFRPALLDDADSVHAEVAREMLLRHDWVTLYANGIRYLEKAPLLYWAMAACMAVAKMLGHASPRCLAVAARIPLALTVLALTFAVESFARRAYRSTRAGLYAGLILLSSFGIFIFTRITIPDAMLCLWLTLAMLCFWRTEQGSQKIRWPSYGFAACCALGVLTKGLIGIVFPLGIVLVYLVLTRGWRGAVRRVFELHPFSSGLVFIGLAAPWHILAALANPTQGHPGGLAFVNDHWTVLLPTDGNVHGWAWFYFVNEQLLRYMNLRVPRDYDTVPLWLFWGLCLVWLMPWGAFVFKAGGLARTLLRAAYRAMHRKAKTNIQQRHLRELLSSPNAGLLLILWAAVPLLFFSFSTRQEYYVLPALPPLAILIADWLVLDSLVRWEPVTQGAKHVRRANLRCTVVLLGLGTIFAVAALYFLLHTRAPAADTDLAALLQKNPGDYAMSMGHFLDLNAQALGLFRGPLALAAASLFLGPLASYLLLKRSQPHVATLALAAGAFGFLLAAHLGLQTFAPVLSSEQLAAAIAPQLHPDDLIVIHQEYEYASTLGFYLQRPSYVQQDGRAVAVNPIHILTEANYNGVANYGRSSNLWYGSFFPDAPSIFETPQSLAAKWAGPQRIFLWQDLANQPSPLPALPPPVYVIAKSGGKEIVSNQPNR
jgi:4-amino-4-deoxy-L-arabinose transferase-like glycosyltransferase